MRVKCFKDIRFPLLVLIIVNRKVSLPHYVVIVSQPGVEKEGTDLINKK